MRVWWLEHASRPEGFVCLGIYSQTNENRLKHFA